MATQPLNISRAYPFIQWQAHPHTVKWIKTLNDHIQHVFTVIKDINHPEYKTKTCYALDWTGANYYGINRPIYFTDIDGNVVWRDFDIDEYQGLWGAEMWGNLGWGGDEYITKLEFIDIESPFNLPDPILASNIANDDIYKKVIKWHIGYKDNGGIMSIPTLKQRIADFMGLTYYDISIVDSWTHNVVTNNTKALLTITFSGNLFLKQLFNFFVQFGVLEMPIGFSIKVV
jgi:hypothetical protein